MLFLELFWGFRLFMNMSYLSVDVAVCLEQAYWCISVVSWLSLIFTLFVVPLTKLFYYGNVLPNLGNTDSVPFFTAVGIVHLRK